MTDKAAVIHTGENSPEYVAWRLFLEVAKAEGKILNSAPNRDNPATREWLLTTFGECITTVRHGYYTPVK